MTAGGLRAAHTNPAQSTTPAAPHDPDARRAGAGSLARTVRAHVETWRPYTLWYIGLVGLAGAASAAGPHHPWRLAAAWAAPTMGWLGGHYLGDYFDRDLDALAKPHRPIPSGRLSPAAAVRWGCLCIGAVAVLAGLGGPGTALAAALGVLGIVAYSRWFKARGIAGNLVRGALGATALVYGALAAQVHIPAATYALVAVFWLHDTTSNLVGTLRDIDGDRAGGYRTLPVGRGAPFAVATVVALFAATLCAAVTAGLLAASGRTAFLATTALAAALGAYAIEPLVRRRHAMTAVIALQAHSILVLERVILASGAVGLGLGLGWQLGLAVPLVLLTWRTQMAMRPRHELGRTLP